MIDPDSGLESNGIQGTEFSAAQLRVLLISSRRGQFAGNIKMPSHIFLAIPAFFTYTLYL
jgi:hypothetical protein